jgi:hypothetical protein
MKIRRRAHPNTPTIGTTKPRSGSMGTKRLPTRNRMGASMDWPLYNAQGELVDRAAIQAKVVARTAANRVQAAANGSSSPASVNAVDLTLEIADEVLRFRKEAETKGLPHLSPDALLHEVLHAKHKAAQAPPKPAKAIPDSPLQAFKKQHSKSPWFISAKGASNGHDSIYLTADNNAKEEDIPTTFQGVQVRITYVRRGAR